MVAWSSPHQLEDSVLGSGLQPQLRGKNDETEFRGSVSCIVIFLTM